MTKMRAWIPAFLLLAGCGLNAAIVARRVGPVPLRAPLTIVAPQLLGATAHDTTVTDEVRRVAGMSDYVIRSYEPAATLPFSIYVGYYDEQRQGKSIHSPKNCLPGDGWEPVESDTAVINTAHGPAVVNRYRVAKEGSQAVVYYWYQGRGRIAHDEFKVKLELLRDAALRGRTEEALVRIAIVVQGNQVKTADSLAHLIAPTLAADVSRALPVY